MIFNIQRFSTHDGNGIRTIVFYKGCPLQCQWCSNPESQSFGYSVMYDRRNCKNFGDCILQSGNAITQSSDGGILIDRTILPDSEKLINTCASRALTVSGEDKSVEEVLAEIEKDRLFFGQDGGVTLSGGEPLAQGDELIGLLTGLKAKSISVAAETSLHVNWEMIERCIGFIDTFLVDIKHTDEEIFKTFTGGDSKLVIDNLVNLSKENGNIIVRIPVIPGFNHSGKEMEMIIDLISGFKNIREIHFLPYHTLGTEKYKMLGMEYKFGVKEAVRDEELSGYIQYAESKGFKIKIGG